MKKVLLVVLFAFTVFDGFSDDAKKEVSEVVVLISISAEDETLKKNIKSFMSRELQSLPNVRVGFSIGDFYMNILAVDGGNNAYAMAVEFLASSAAFDELRDILNIHLSYWLKENEVELNDVDLFARSTVGNLLMAGPLRKGIHITSILYLGNSLTDLREHCMHAIVEFDQDILLPYLRGEPLKY